MVVRVANEGQLGGGLHGRGVGHGRRALGVVRRVWRRVGAVRGRRLVVRLGSGWRRSSSGLLNSGRPSWSSSSAGPSCGAAAVGPAPTVAHLTLRHSSSVQAAADAGQDAYMGDGVGPGFHRWHCW